MSLRCPFCHDVITHDAPDRVQCAGCAADHHVDCFVEHASCGATACGSDRVRVGQAEVSLEVLTELARDPEQLKGLAVETAAPRASLGIGGMVLGILVTVLLAFVGHTIGELVGFEKGGTAIGALFGAMAFAHLARPSRDERPAVRVRTPGEPVLTYDPIFGVATENFIPGTLPDQHETLRRRLAESAPPAELQRVREATAGEAPEACPWCAQHLEVEDDEPLVFCYHCGGDLASAPLQRGPDEAERA